uniref:Uncharacterized protein n=1 Tax=Arundo donax TaxID=35708 RepID=A0A0A9DJX7_ARUDO
MSLGRGLPSLVTVTALLFFGSSFKTPLFVGILPSPVFSSALVFVSGIFLSPVSPSTLVFFDRTLPSPVSLTTLSFFGNILKTPLFPCNLITSCWPESTELT